MEKRCFGCMRIKTQSPICEHCGYNENIDNLPHQLPIGTLLRDQYRIGKVLGQGGFGITYLAWDENLDMPVAVKEFYPNGSVNREHSITLDVTCTGGNTDSLFESNRERFLREAKTLARLRSVPEIVHVHSFFRENNTAYIIMEYVQGVDLRAYLRMQGRPFRAEELFRLLEPIMDALKKVHEQGVVHRDISPDNIMLLPDGRAKLLDFGAVRDVENADVGKELPRSTEAILKHGFAPIEQYQRRGSLGPWTDVYALCATMYYCLTGDVPADAPERLMNDEPVGWDRIPGLNRTQIAALEKGMAHRAADRYASVGELLGAMFAAPAVKSVEPPAAEPVEQEPAPGYFGETVPVEPEKPPVVTVPLHREEGRPQPVPEAPVEKKAVESSPVQTAPINWGSGQKQPVPLTPAEKKAGQTTTVQKPEPSQTTIQNWGSGQKQPVPLTPAEKKAGLTTTVQKPESSGTTIQNWGSGQKQPVPMTPAERKAAEVTTWLKTEDAPQPRWCAGQKQPVPLTPAEKRALGLLPEEEPEKKEEPAAPAKSDLSGYLTKFLKNRRG